MFKVSYRLNDQMFLSLQVNRLMIRSFCNVVVLLLSIPALSVAGEDQKRINLGLSYYSLQLYDETWSYDSDRLNGVSLSGAYLVSDRLALRGTYYQLGSGDFDNTDAAGAELLAYYGRGLATRGGKWYIGAGYFNERWDTSGNSQKFDGLQLGGGFGYNWDKVAFDLLLQFRDVSDYAEYLDRPEAEINTAGVLSLMLSTRF